MSRSFRRRACIGRTHSNSESYDKRLANRRLRRIVREHITNDDYRHFTIRHISNIWLFAKDGKFWFIPWEFPVLMRK